MKRWRDHLGLLPILAAFFALGVIYLQVTPLLETPGEPSHFSVVKYIADEKRLPPPRSAPSDAGPVPTIEPGVPVYYAPPLYYVLGALLIADLDTDGFAQAVIPNPNWARGWAPTPGRSPENKNVYVHTAEQRPPYAGWAVAMLRLRLFSLLLGGATVVGVYALARQLGPSPWPLATAALVAFNPAYLFVTTGVTNDALVAALCTWAFVLMVRLFCRPSARPGEYALLGGVLGLGALTKQSGLILLPVAALAAVWPTQSRRQGLKRLMWVLLPFTLIAGWWYVHNALRYHDPLGFAPHRPPLQDWSPSLSLIIRQLGQVFQSYWGAFGWGLILVEPAIYFLIGAFALGGLLGWLRREDIERDAAVMLALGVLLNLAGLLLWLWRTPAPYGRLLYPSIGPLGGLMVVGWRRWLRPRSARLFAWAVVGVMGFYAIVVPFRYLQPAYARPVVPPSAVQEATRENVWFGDSIRLVGYQMSADRLEPGDRIALILYWQATAEQKTDLTLFVQLALKDPAQRIAGDDDFLGSSRYPTRVWRPGEVVMQTVQLELPLDAYAPALYWFIVGLYDPAGERLPAVVDGVPLLDRAVRLGPVWLLKRDVEPLGKQVYYRLGSAIRLVGYQVRTARPDVLDVTLDWRATDAVGGDWTVFVHLLNEEGNIVTQHDGPPRDGDYPTWAWDAGDRVLDTHTLSLPNDLTPGYYRLQVGLYQPEGDVRMPVFDVEDQPVPDDSIVLTEIALPLERNWDEN